MITQSKIQHKSNLSTRISAAYSYNYNPPTISPQIMRLSTVMNTLVCGVANKWWLCVKVFRLEARCAGKAMVSTSHTLFTN